MSSVLVATTTYLLIRRGLWPIYRAFVVFCMIQTIRQLCLLVLEYQHYPMAKAWAIQSLILWCAQITMVAEISQLVFAHYPNIGRTADVVRWCAFLAALGVAMCLSTQDIPYTEWRTYWFHIVCIVGRCVHWLSAGILLLQMLFLRIAARIPMSRNLQRHRRLACAYALTIACTWLFVPSSNRAIADAANTLMVIICAGLDVLWVLGFRTEWEKVPQTRKTFSAEEKVAVISEYAEAGAMLRRSLVHRG